MMQSGSPARPSAAHGPLQDTIAVIDAHHHIWDLDTNVHPWLRDEPPPPFRYGDSRPLRRNYLPVHYRADAAGFNIVATVYAEAEHDPTDPLRETRWVHQIAERDGLPQAMTAAAFLDRDDARNIISAQAAFPLVRSIRHKPRGVVRPQDYTSGHQIAGSMRCPRWRAGYRHLGESGLHFELQTPWWHLDDACELAATFPDTLIILNHLGLPADRSPTALQAWHAAMSRLAQVPNVRVKLSGICVPGARWTPELNGWIVREAIRLFGAERCMWASNFPVDGLVASYADILNAMFAITRDLASADRTRIFSGTAAEVYRL
jgi:predicted TIM-barrel fold metal-dependent hydrolase